MRRYRYVLHIPYTDHITNQEIGNLVEHSVRRHDELPTMVRAVWSCHEINIIMLLQSSYARHSEWRVYTDADRSGEPLLVNHLKTSGAPTNKSLLEFVHISNCIGVVFHD